jgi:hypothetical protein
MHALCWHRVQDKKQLLLVLLLRVHHKWLLCWHGAACVLLALGTAQASFHRCGGNVVAGLQFACLLQQHR